MPVGWNVRFPKAAVNSQSSAYRRLVWFWFTSTRWTGEGLPNLRGDAALTLEAFSFSCVAVLQTLVLEARLPVHSCVRHAGMSGRDSVQITVAGVGLW